VLSPYDGPPFRIGILSSHKVVGYGSGNMPMPIVSGQDAKFLHQSMLRGEQYSNDLQGHPDLAKVTAKWVDAALTARP